MDDTNDFEDPFSYIPLKRRRKPSKSNPKPTQSKPLSTQRRPASKSQKKTPYKSPTQKASTKTPHKSPKTRKSPKSIKNRGKDGGISSQNRLTQTSPVKQLSMDLFTNKENNKSKINGHCPLCQMPLRLLGDQSPEVHYASCCETSRTEAEDCPLGIECNSLSKHHYVQYRHDELARHRDLGLFDLPTEIKEPDGRNGTVDASDRTRVQQRMPTPRRRLTGGPPADRGTTRTNVNSDICIDLTRDDSPPARVVAGASSMGRRPAPNLNVTELNVQEEIEPPLTNSTPARQRRVISPIEPRNVNHLTRITEDGGSAEKSRLSSGHVNRFLLGVQQEKQKDNESVSLLAAVEQRAEPRKNPGEKDDMFDDEEEIFDDALDHLINKACDDLASSNVACKDIRSNSPDLNGIPQNPRNERRRSGSTAYSQEPGPSRVNNQQGLQNAPDSRTPRQGSTGSSNLKFSDVQTLCTESPFQVRAVKDSEELELSLDLNSHIKCKSLKVRVPLKGGKVPVEVTARYSDASSPSKQAKITSYFGVNKNPDKTMGTSNHSLEVSEYEPESSEVFVVKKRKVEEAMEQWKKIFKSKPKAAVTESGDNRQGYTEEEPKRKVPFYKKISGTTFAVDAFNYGLIPGVLYYFLTHYHYDHYGGLTRRWSKSIVCSSLTKRMVVRFLNVDEKLVTTLDPGETRVFDSVEVSSVDANHCPGSVMFVFRLTTGKTILHVGDFRACPEMESDPVFWNYRNIDTVYLDTTYCKPEYDFPPQHSVIEHSILQVEEIMAKYKKVAVIVGAYTIGKERIFKGIAEHLDCKVWANNYRVKTWNALEDPVITKRMTKDRCKAQVHVIEQKKLCWSGLEKEYEEIKGTFNHILGIKPTGWTHSTGLDPESSLSSIRTKTRGPISFLEVPYSEHSSYSEIKRFIQFLRIKSSRQIIPTVNLRDRARMNSFFDEWIKENRFRGPESQ